MNNNGNERALQELQWEKIFLYSSKLMSTWTIISPLPNPPTHQPHMCTVWCHSGNTSQIRKKLKVDECIEGFVTVSLQLSGATNPPVGHSIENLNTTFPIRRFRLWNKSLKSLHPSSCPLFLSLLCLLAHNPQTIIKDKKESKHALAKPKSKSKIGTGKEIQYMYLLHDGKYNHEAAGGTNM